VATAINFLMVFMFCDLEVSLAQPDLPAPMRGRASVIIVVGEAFAFAADAKAANLAYARLAGGVCGRHRGPGGKKAALASRL
jgi:hypothetical protein